MPTIGFPLLLIPFAIYNIVAFLMHGVGFSAPVITLRLISGAEWAISFGDMLVALGIVLMLFEFNRSSRPGSKYVMDHLLSLVVFAGGVAEFLWLPAFATSTFFLLVVLSGLDFLSALMWAFRYRKWVRADRRYAAEQAAQATTTVVAPAQSAEKTPPAFEAAPKQEEMAPARLEVVTPEIDMPPEKPDVKTEPAKPVIDTIPDPEPAMPHKPAQSIAEWNVADIVRGVGDQPPADKPADGAAARPAIVPSRD